MGHLGPGALPEGAAAALRGAIARGEIAVRYQPVVRVSDRRPILVEALARWHHLALPVDPDAFVGLAEREGLARPLAAAIAARVAAELGPGWRRLGLGVSINLPLALLLRPEIPGLLRRLFAPSGLRPRQIAIELTETTPVRDPAALRRALRRLRAAGHRVLLDDLMLGDPRARLLALPFAAVKCDRSVVAALPGSARARAAVRRMVAVAARRGQEVIAEGVEDRRHWGLVRALGVHAAQGYGVGRPVPATGLLHWRAAWRGGGVRATARSTVAITPLP